MRITFYLTTDDTRVVDKTLTVKSITDGHFKGDVDVEKPILLVNPTSDILTSNYAHVDMLNRYYFVNPDESKNLGNVLELHLEEDVLFTNKDDIRSIVGTIDRNENERNGYLIDNQYQAYGYESVVTKAFPEAMEEDSIILMTVG